MPSARITRTGSSIIIVYLRVASAVTQCLGHTDATHLMSFRSLSWDGLPSTTPAPALILPGSSGFYETATSIGRRDVVHWLNADFTARRMLNIRGCRITRSARDEFRDKRKRHWVGDSNLALRIDGNPAPTQTYPYLPVKPVYP